MVKNDDNLIWIDLEMTGLDTDNDRIIEIATIITDSELNSLEEGPVIAIHQPDEVMNSMDGWNTKQHGGSGLTARVKASTETEQSVVEQTIAFLSRYIDKGKSPMCGNSICQDRRFLHRCMPELEEYFHYRNLDVSSIKELVKRWKPEAAAGFTKSSEHLAMQDIRDSIAELKFYRENVFSI
ncbi:MAG: oligoribonuclease [Gammaproteobacteria bacterium]|nr:oligoribonuclease [bacterium AH-315-E07]PCH59872.1 MAG: oligoribonuclease [Gammaproteobacteria bacterium]